MNRSYISTHFLLSAYFLIAQTYKRMHLITQVYSITKDYHSIFFSEDNPDVPHTVHYTRTSPIVLHTWIKARLRLSLMSHVIITMPRLTWEAKITRGRTKHETTSSTATTRTCGNDKTI